MPDNIRYFSHSRCFLRDVQALNDRKRGPQYAAVLMVVLDTLSLVGYFLISIKKWPFTS